MKKFLNSLPQSKYIQIIASLEQVLDLNKTSFKDIVGRLKAYEERIQEEDTQEPQGNLLYTRTPINHTTQEEELDVGIMVEETKEEGVEEATHKIEVKRRRILSNYLLQL